MNPQLISALISLLTPGVVALVAQYTPAIGEWVQHNPVVYPIAMLLSNIVNQLSPGILDPRKDGGGSLVPPKNKK